MEKKVPIIDKVRNLTRLKEAKGTVVRLLEECVLKQGSLLLYNLSRKMEGLSGKNNQETAANVQNDTIYRVVGLPACSPPAPDRPRFY